MNIFMCIIHFSLGVVSFTGVLLYLRLIKIYHFALFDAG